MCHVFHHDVSMTGLVCAAERGDGRGCDAILVIDETAEAQQERVVRAGAGLILLLLVRVSLIGFAVEQAPGSLMISLNVFGCLSSQACVPVHAAQAARADLLLYDYSE